MFWSIKRVNILKNMIYIIIAILFFVCVIGYALYVCVLRREDPDMSDYSLIA